MDLDPERDVELRFTACGSCSSCCDGSLFTVGFVPLMDFIETAKCFPIVFHKIYGEYWPGMIYSLRPGLPCPYLDAKKQRCTIYETFRPVACTNFPVRFKAKDSAAREPFVGFPFTLELDERCPGLERGVPGTRFLDAAGSLTMEFLDSMQIPSRIGFVEETRSFCRELNRYGLFKKKKFKRKGAGSKGIKAIYQIADKKRLEQEYPELLEKYSSYLVAHWSSLQRLKKLIESS